MRRPAGLSERFPTVYAIVAHNCKGYRPPVATNAVSNFFHELRRRHVVRIAVAYAVVAWVLLQVAAIVLPSFGAPGWVLRVVIGLFILFFPVALILAWAFEITAEGVRRTPPRSTLPADWKAADTGGLLRLLAARKARRARDRQGGHTPGPVRAARSAPGARARSGRRDAGAGSDRERPRAARDTALSKLRHDLRSPINAIVGYAEMLLEEGVGESGSETATDLEKIAKAGRELQHAVDEIFDPANFGRLEHAPAAAREAFARDVQHRLRTPLNAATGYPELILEREGAAAEALRTDLGKIGEAARDLLGHVDAIVDFCLTAAEGAENPAGYDELSGLAREALARIRAGEPDADIEPTLAGAALFVVDDNKLDRDLLSKRLALQGFTVSAAATGKEALERMHRQGFDLVFLDVIMPELDGLDVLSQMKNDPALAEIPVIMVSGLDETGAAVHCIEAGAVDFITKPFEPVLLRARLAAALRARQAALLSRGEHDALQVQETLLDRIFENRFPVAIGERLRRGETTIAERYDETSVLAIRFAGLAIDAPGADPQAALEQLRGARAWLHALARESGVDAVVFHDLEAIVLPGPHPASENSAGDDAAFAVRILEALPEAGAQLGAQLSVKMGLHTGAVTAGVAGEESLAYELWGETVGIARALAARAPADVLQLSAAAKAQIGRDHPLEDRGVVDLGEGLQLRTFVLGGRGGNGR